MKTQPTPRMIAESLIKQLRGNYSAGWSEDRDALCVRVVKQLLDEIGAERLEKAVHMCTANEQFFSEQALRKWIPSLQTRRKYCYRCEKMEGWIYVLVDGSRKPRVLRCDHSQQSHFRVYFGTVDDSKSGNAVACDFIEEQSA